MRTTHMTRKRFIEAEEIQKDGYRGNTLIHKGDFFITYRQEVTKDGEATYVIPKELFHALFKEIDPVKAWKNIEEFLASTDEEPKDVKVFSIRSEDGKVKTMTREEYEMFREGKWDPFKDTQISISPVTDDLRKAMYDSAGSGAMGVTKLKFSLTVTKDGSVGIGSE